MRQAAAGRQLLQAETHSFLQQNNKPFLRFLTYAVCRLTAARTPLTRHLRSEGLIFELEGKKRDKCAVGFTREINFFFSLLARRWEAVKAKDRTARGVSFYYVPRLIHADNLERQPAGAHLPVGQSTIQGQVSRKKTLCLAIMFVRRI